MNELIERLAREAGWTGIYVTWAEPTGKPDFTPMKESLTVPVTKAQIEAFAKAVARECTEIASNQIGPRDDLGGQSAAHAIRERFGL